MGEKLVGVEAAHIKWHKAGGPDVENNGIALCSLHHKLFDLGVYTIDDQLRMLVSEKVHGKGADQWLISFHGKSLRPPQSRSYYPEVDYLEWHVNEVFKGGYRKLE
jgi:putative restriction endonuclease